MTETRTVEWLMKNLTHSIDMGSHCTQCGDSYCEHKNVPRHLDFAQFIYNKVGIDIKNPDLRDASYLNLADSLLTEGFRKPICIVECADGRWMMGNGHHRLAMAILTCMDEVPVAISDWEGEYMLTDLTHESDYSQDRRWSNND